MSCSFKHKTKAFSRRRSHRQEGKKWKKVHTPPPRTKFVLFWLKNKSLLQNENNSGPSNLLFFFSFASKCPSESDWCARPGSNERAFLRLGRKKIDFVRTWGRCSLSSSPSPWLYVYLDGINVTLCVCVTEKVRVSSQNEERSARKARKLRETETH